MPTIHKLKPEIVAKIAAGEVAERPASIIKELIENSLDAKAEHIDIFLSQGGINTIVIRDDGVGMSKEDLLLSYLPHTTSKIKDADDLHNIASFGFRGEALASISAVSNISIKSRHIGSEVGYEIEVDNGQLIHEGSVGLAIGTEIRVESLFAKTPARKKFLGDAKTELRAVNDVITRFALAFPTVGFTLTNDSTEFLNIPSQQTVPERMNELIGREMRDHSIPITHETQYGKISGFIGKPQTATKASTHRYLFINQRPVVSYDLAKHIVEAYGSLIEPRTSAPHVLYLELPYDCVDVNIHPRKEEVAFEYPQQIKKLISESILLAFEEHDLTYRDTATEISKPGMDNTTASMLKSIVTPWFPNELKPDEILQVHNVYLIAQTSNGIIIADQHAVHERILFEQFKDALETLPLTIYNLPEPIIFELSLDETLLLEANLDTLDKLGFVIELFGARTFKLSSVPEMLRYRDHKKHILEVLHDLEANLLKPNVDRESERTLAYLACRSAIKAGDPLSPDERKRLIEKILEAKTPYTCPHGRPTHIELSQNELDRLFKRH
jgi:DNA mismatch repair protein MutL